MEYRNGLEFLKLLTFYLLYCGSVSAFQNRSIEEVVAKQSPQCVVKKKNIFLTKMQMQKIANMANSKMPSGIVLAFELTCENQKKVMYIHSDIVRTLNQTLAIFVGAQNKVEKITRVSFLEPVEYLAPKKWLNQYLGQVLNEKLEVRRDIDALSGATLTANATNDAVRRVLAMHKVLEN